MKNKNGFTLIELLAIIVILAVIMAIAIPQVLNVVNGSKESAWKDNVKMIAKSMELNTQLYDAETGAYTYTIDGLCQTPSSVNEISKADDTTITCNNGVFTLTGTNQFSGKSATIDCSSGNCTVTFTEGGTEEIALCPGPECRYLYTTTTYKFGTGASTLAASATKANYNDVVSASGKQYFLGVILSDGDHGTIERAFACGNRNGNLFCLEGRTDGSLFAKHKTFLKNTYGPYDGSTELGCEEDTNSSVTFIDCMDSVLSAGANSDGTVGVYARTGVCDVVASGELFCR